MKFKKQFNSRDTGETDDYKIVNTDNAFDIKIEHLLILYQLIEEYFQE